MSFFERTEKEMSELQNFAIPPTAGPSCVVAAPQGDFTTQFNSWRYYNYGPVTRDWETGYLRRPAPIGDWLRPLMWNSGCAGQTCPNATTCPNGQNLQPGPETAAMLQNIFKVEEFY